MQEDYRKQSVDYQGSGCLQEGSGMVMAVVLCLRASFVDCEMFANPLGPNDGAEAALAFSRADVREARRYDLAPCATI